MSKLSVTSFDQSVNAFVYQATLEAAAGCVIAGIIWTGFVAVAWRPWVR